MDTLIIDGTKYIIMPKKEYENLRLKAAVNSAPVRKSSLLRGKKHAYKLIEKWTKNR